MLVEPVVFLPLLFSLTRKNGLPQHRATSYRSLRQDRPLAFRQFTITPRMFTFDQLRLATSTRSQARGQSQKPDQAPRPTRATVKRINMAFALGDAVMILAECVFFCPPGDHALPLPLRRLSSSSSPICSSSLQLVDRCHYFVLDLCDSAKVFCVPTLARISPMGDASPLFNVCLVLANGSLQWAIPAWKNGLVFHDLTKQRGISINSRLAMVVYCIRW